MLNMKEKKSTYLLLKITLALSTTVIEISSDSGDEVTYTETTPPHQRDRLRQKIKEEASDSEDEVTYTKKHPLAQEIG